MAECNSVCIRTNKNLVLLPVSPKITVHTLEYHDINWIGIFGGELTISLTREPVRIAMVGTEQIWLLGCNWLDDDMKQIWPAVPEKVEVEA